MYMIIFYLAASLSVRYVNKVRYYLSNVRIGEFLYSYVEILSLTFEVSGLI